MWADETEREERVHRQIMWSIALLTAAALLGVLLLHASGCGALFGSPEIPATYGPEGEIISGTIEATPGLLPQIGAALEKSGWPLGTIIAGVIGAVTTVVQTVRVRRRVAAEAVVEAADRAQLQMIALNHEPPHSATRVDIGDILGHALRSISPADAKKVEAAFRASRTGK